MNKATQKIIAISAALLLVIVLTVGTGIVIQGIYTKQSDSAAARLVAKAFSLPVANVDGKTIKYDRFIQTRDAVRKFINSDAGKDVGATMPPEKELNENILEQLIRQKLVESVAEEKGISVTDEEVNDIFAEVADQAASSTDSTITEYLQENYGWNENNFRDYVLRPALLEQKVSNEVATEADPYALENILITKRQKPEVVVYLRFE